MLIHAWTRSMLLWDPPGGPHGTPLGSPGTPRAPQGPPRAPHGTLGIGFSAKNHAQSWDQKSFLNTFFFKIKCPQLELVTVEWNPGRSTVL